MADATQQPMMSDEPDAVQPSDSTPTKTRVQFQGLHLDALFRVLAPYINSISHLLLAFMEKLRPMVRSSLSAKAVIFWVAVQVMYTHPTKEMIDMTPKYLTSWRRTLVNSKDIDDKVDEVVRTILLRNAHYIPDNSGLVLEHILRMNYKADEYLPLVGRDHELPQFLSKETIINVRNRESRCFGYAFLSALYGIKVHRERPNQYEPIFRTYELDKIPYPVAIEDIPATEDKLAVSINVFPFFDDEGKARLPLCVGEWPRECGLSHLG